MTSINFKTNSILYCFAALPIVVFFMTINACTVKRTPILAGKIPKMGVQSPGSGEFGADLFQELRADYDLDTDHTKRGKLVEIFNRLTKAAEVDHLPWHIYLLKAPETIDIRAVHGNYIFVWSGVLDAVANDDEIAGLLACELSHTLAHHNDPVEFTIASDVLFSVMELATSLGIMVASQGMVVIGGQGWMKWAYVELADLDPLDLEYSPEEEREAADIALRIIGRTQYSPLALLDFWKRVAMDESIQERYERFSRDLSPQDRAALLEELILKPPEGNNQLAKKPNQ
jgi:predicted Zn-dependent protease